MTNDKKAFKELLSKAQLYEEPKTMMLVGSLARSPEEGKFALMQADGNVVSLDIDAYKSHTVIGSSFGHQIVQVELDAEKVPQNMTGQSQVTPMRGIGQPPPPIWTDARTPDTPKILQDPIYPKFPTSIDHPPRHPYQMLSRTTYPLNDHNTGYKDNPHRGSLGPPDIPVPLQPELVYHNALAALLPFLLATAHQAPSDALDQM